MTKAYVKKLYILCNISLLLAAIISGLSFVAQKIGMIYVEPFTFNTLRCFIGTISLIPLMVILGRYFKEENNKNSGSELFKGGVFCGFILFSAFSVNQYCMIYSNAGKAGFITSLYIIFVPIIAVFLKHKLNKKIILSILIALIGIYLLCTKGAMSFEKYDILLLLSSFLFALHIIVVSHYSKKTDTLKLSSLQFFIAGLFSLPLMFIFETPSINAILEGAAPILFIGTIVTGGAYSLQIFGHKATKAVLATLILSSEAVFAVIGGVFLLGETLKAKEIAGCVMIMAAIIISQIQIKRKKEMYMKKQIYGKTYDQERSLYNLKNTEIIDCKFEGPLDGESVLKECRKFSVTGSTFSLRYPIWHAKDFSLIDCKMDEKTRAPIWYSSKGKIENSLIEGIKCLRECDDITVENCNIVSDEFGWKCKNITISNSKIDSVYFLLETQNVEIKNITMKGKYSFQYMKNFHIKDSTLDTKDAFWHSKNIVVENSYVKGEYLGWFSENLTLINCTISGTQPLCYCKNLKLINCIMEDTDLSFEYSDVEADIKGHVISIKNPKSGIIKADSIGEIITDEPVMKCSTKILVKNNQINKLCKAC